MLLCTIPSIGLWVVFLQGSLSATSFIQLHILLDFFQHQTLPFSTSPSEIIGEITSSQFLKKNAIRRLAVLSLDIAFYSSLYHHHSTCGIRSS